MSKAETLVKPDTPPKALTSEWIDWMKFPRLAEAFEPSPNKTLALLTQKHQEQLEKEKSGTPAERVNARVIAAGYARTSALLQELEMARLKHIKKEATEA